jgi:hypothetical protein
VVANRITQPINPDVRYTLQHNVHPLAQAKYDQGTAPGSMPTGRIMLVLKRSDAQEQALKQYLGDLQNPNSGNYRKWITPAQFGKLYGISDTDLTAVTAWLQSQGFTVDKIPQARNVIEFSGNVAQIQQAFNTSIHKYVVNGETHFANSTNPQIPAALAPVIAGVAQLNDFVPKRGAIVKSQAHFDTSTNRIKPDLTLTNGNGTDILFADAADAATIYDTPNSALNPKYSGTTYDGTGVTIGIAGDSNITAQDIQLYRSAFLPSSYSANQPNVIVDGNDPGVNGDAVEALLDLEVSGGIAPGAKINFYTSANTDLQQGLFLAIFRALDDNAVSILNVSFGACELSQGASGNAQILTMWEQAAAQGMSVTVSTGDSGSANCDNANTENVAKGGLAVSGLASTPYNIAVGGTDYDVLLNDFSTYVAAGDSAQNVASTYYRTALSYIPESPWNDSTSTNSGGYTANKPTMINGATTIAGAGGGVSSTALCSIPLDANGNCNAVLGPYPQPPFQSGVTNSVSTSARALPDVSLLAADGLYNALWVVCSDSVANGSMTPGTDCEQASGSFTSGTTFTGVGGTSAASPAFAGMLALVSQSQGGVRLGQANNVLYNLANQSSLYSTIFHDVTTGNNSVFCSGGTLANCGTNSFLTGYNAGTGYDAASGLGSVDVAQLITNWKKAAFTPTTTTLATTSNTSVTHGANITFNIGVSPAPGQSAEFVSLINNSGLENNGALVDGAIALKSGAATVTTGDLPGGSYNVYAYYGGDVNHTGSQSTPIAVNISPEASQVAIGATMFDPLTGNTVCDDVTGSAQSCVGLSAPYGLATSISAQVQGASGSNTVATGSISFADTAGSLPGSPVAISSNGIASYNNYVNQNQSLPVSATNGITATYGGDPSYAASNSGSAYNLSIVQAGTSVAVVGSESGTTVTLQAQINTDSIGLAPSGTMTFSVGSTTLGTAPTASQTGFVSSGTVASLYQIAIPATTAGLVNGSNTITAKYSGDANYTGSSASANVTITGGGTGGSYTLSGTGINIAAGATTGNTSTITVTPASSGFSGTVALTCAVTSSPTGATAGPTCSLNPVSVTVSGKAATSTLTVNTTAPSSSGALSYPLKNVFAAAGGTALACLLMFTIPARRKGWRTILSLIVFALAISAGIGCGGSSNSGGGGSVGGTTPGNYVVTVTGTSGSTSTTAAVTVMVN